MIKRFEVRRRICHPMEVITSDWDQPLVFDTTDLSPRGAFVQTPLLPQVDETVICSFVLGKKKFFEFFGKVVRVNLKRRKSDRDGGFAVEFLDTKPLERIAIRDHLRGTPPPTPVMRKLPNGITVTKKN